MILKEFEINTFKKIVNNTSLLSVNFIIKKHKNEILLGERINRSAKIFILY